MDDHLGEPVVTEGAGHAAIVVSGQPFDETIDFLCARLGFRPDATWPADDPSTTIVTGHGLRLRVDRDVEATPMTLILQVDDPGEPVTAPNGLTIVCRNDTAVSIPELVPELVINHSDDDAWGVGRSGMRYRDLIPSRLGGRFIASNIEVSDGGPIPDRVHHHAIRFQMIFCEHGWVDVVYEDQGDPFRMNAGDCVLQPPHIRHQVLASSAGARVVEIGCPAEHQTLFDHELELPNGTVAPDRLWAGQQFVRHIAAEATESDWRSPGWVERDTGIGAATAGLAGATVIRATAAGASFDPRSFDGEFEFVFGLGGSAQLSLGATFEAGSTATIPTGSPWAFTAATPDFSFLRVTLPG